MLGRSVFITICLLTTASFAWDYDDSSPFGPAHWGTLFPACNPTTSQQSPIGLTSADLATTNTVAARYSFHRQQTTHNGDIFLITSPDAGGLVKTLPSEAVPFVVVSWNADGTEQSRRTKYLHSIAWHSAVEHAGVQSNANAEMQIHLADRLGGPPTMVISQLLDWTTTTLSTKVPFSIPELALESIGESANNLAAGGAVSTVLHDANVDLFFNFSTEDAAMSAVRYAGAVSSPYCTPVSEVIVLSNAFLIPYTLYQRLLHSSSSIDTKRPLQTRLGSTTTTRVVLAAGYPMNSGGVLVDTPAPTVIQEVLVPHTVMSEEAQRLRVVVIALGALCVGLSLVLTMLVLARWEVIDVPMWLGGIAKPVEFWTNPESTKVFLTDNDDDDDDEVQHEEAANDEETEDEEGEEGETGTAPAA